MDKKSKFNKFETQRTQLNENKVKRCNLHFNFFIFYSYGDANFLTYHYVNDIIIYIYIYIYAVLDKFKLNKLHHVRCGYN